MGSKLHEQELGLASCFSWNHRRHSCLRTQGFVIGPMAVVLAYGLIRFLATQSNNQLLEPEFD